ncbi:MAG TPA: hypothetical protein VMS01_14150 [Stellaceae bacterium]|jgi:hypothetical protein|nr:hypothetical protein [Stellaceae bacterium]
MPNWSSRLEVQVNSVTLTPITSFTTTFASSVTQIHSIEADNVGVIVKPQTMTFTMTVPALGPDQTNPHSTAASLYQLAIAGTAFDVALSVASGTDWVFQQLLFRGCYITSANPSSVNVGTTSGLLDTVPVAMFSGIVTDFAAAADITLAP